MRQSPDKADVLRESSAASGGRSALVLGATGLVGGHCVDLLLADPRYTTVRVMGRRSLGLQNAKLEERTVDLEKLDDESDFFRVDAVFCCLGTTIKKAGSQEAFRKVDVEYPVSAATLAAKSGAETFLIVSALGANPRSRVFYSRSKGEMEERVKAAGMKNVWILQPSLLVGERAEERTGELIGEAVLRILKPLLVGPLREYRAIQARDVARAMMRLAARPGSGTVSSDQIATIAQQPDGPPA